MGEAMCRQTLLTLLTLAVIAALAGCLAPGPQAPSPQAHARVTGIERLDISIAGVLLVKRDHNLGSYDQLMVDPIIVALSRNSSKLGRSETERLKTHLRKATARELVNVDASKIVSRPGPCVLRMQTAFIDLELPKIEPYLGSDTSIIHSFGSVTLVHELRDSMTGTVLMRYMGRRHAPGGSTIGWVAKWSGLTRTLDRMLADLQQSLLESVPLHTATEGPLAQCSGLIHKRIEEDPGGG
jgi:hypothetical protein